VEASSEAFKSLKNSAQDRVGERRIIGSMVRRRVYQRGFEMSISAAQVKELRELTGAGMMDCKAALAETNGDMEAAVDWLRKKGIAKADKKAGRTAAEGLIGVDSGLREAAIVEVNSETDFVARNEAFQESCATSPRWRSPMTATTRSLRLPSIRIRTSPWPTR
jgi:hypothetical protein